ncbi:13116_t:CDS:2, partial [Acaulospora colombiana]
MLLPKNLALKNPNQFLATSVQEWKPASPHPSYLQKFPQTLSSVNNLRPPNVNISSASLTLETQRKASAWPDNYLEWIDFNQFKEIYEVGEGDKGQRCSQTVVALKSIKNSQSITPYYVQNLKTYYLHSTECPKRIHNYLQFYGITQYPSTGEYMLVTQYANRGNLRQFMHSSPRSFSRFRWTEKLWWLCDIISNLAIIHKEGHVHGNLHTGNILQTGKDRRETHSSISDLGLCIPADSTCPISTTAESLRGNSLCYGVLPFIAPEVLLGNPVSKYSDIYSIGVLMVEIANGKPPFHDRAHDHDLASEVCRGRRPMVTEGFAPENYVNLAAHCCHENPLKRPTVKHLSIILPHWYQCANGSLDANAKCKDIRLGFLKAEQKVQEEAEYGQRMEMMGSSASDDWDSDDFASDYGSESSEGSERFTSRTRSEFTDENDVCVREMNEQMCERNGGFEIHPGAVYTSRLLNFEISGLQQAPPPQPSPTTDNEIESYYNDSEFSLEYDLPNDFSNL